MTPRDEVAPFSALLRTAGSSISGSLSLVDIANEKNELWNDDLVSESGVSQQFRSSVAQKNKYLHSFAWITNKPYDDIQIALA